AREPGDHSGRTGQRHDSAWAGAGQNELSHVHALHSDVEFPGSLGGVPQVEHVALQCFTGPDAVLDGRADVVELLPGEYLWADTFQERVDIVKVWVEDQGAPDTFIHGRGHAQLEHEAVACGGGKLKGLFFFHAVAIGEDAHEREAVFPVKSGYGA